MTMATVDLEAAWQTFTTELAAVLEADGLVVTNNPQELAPPCVLVGAPTPTRTRLAGWRAITLEVPVQLLAPPPGDADATRWLLRWLPTVADALGVQTMTPATYNGVLPGYLAVARMTVTADDTFELVDLEPADEP